MVGKASFTDSLLLPVVLVLCVLFAQPINQDCGFFDVHLQSSDVGDLILGVSSAAHRTKAIKCIID